MASNNPFNKYVDTASNGVDSSGQSTTPTNASNPFMKHTEGQYTAPVSQNSIPQQSQQPDQGPGMAIIDRWNRAFGRIAEGTIAKISSAIGAENFKNKTIDYQKQQEKEAGISAKQHPIATAITAPIADTAAYLAFGGAAAPISGAVVPAIGIGSGIAAGQSFLGSPADATFKESLDNAINTGFVSAGLGAGLSVAGQGFKAAYKDLAGKLDNALPSLAPKGVDYGKGQLKESNLLQKTFTPKKAAEKDLAMKVSQEASPNLSLPKKGQPNLTPAEAIGGENMREFELRTMVSDKTKGMLNARQQEVIGKATQDLQSTLDNMGPTKEAIAQKNKIYENLSNVTVPQDQLDDLLSNPSIATRYKEILDTVDQTAKMRAAPANSLAKIEATREAISREIWTNKNPALVNNPKPLKPSELRALQEAYEQVNSTMDNVYPELIAARKTAERLQVQKLYTDALDSIKNTKGNVEPTLDQVANKFFGSVKQKRYFLENVERTGGNVENAENIIETIQHLKGSPVNDLLKKSPNMKGVYFGTSGEGIVQQIYQRLTEGLYNKQLVKLMLSSNGEWQNIVKKIMYNKDPMNRAFKLGEMLKDMKSGAGTVYDKAMATNLIPNKLLTSVGMKPRDTSIGLTREQGKTMIKRAVAPAMGLAVPPQSNKD